MRGGEKFSRQVRDPVTELVVTCHGNTNPLTVKGMAYREGGVSSIAVVRKVWGL